MFNQPPSMPPVSGQGFSNQPSPVPTKSSVAPAGSARLEKSVSTSLIKTIVIALLGLLLVGALVLAYYFYNESRLATADVEAKVENALTAREKEITDKLEAEFAEREKLNYRTLTGPEDYGSLSLKYPKTWSAYVAKDASQGGEYDAYLHPAEVPPVGNANTIFALHVQIKSESFETADNRYKSLVQSGKLTTSVISVGGVDATRYDGTFANNLVGSAVIFKIRDKTVTIETGAEIYRDDFAKILNTITFNQ